MPNPTPGVNDLLTLIPPVLLAMTITTPSSLTMKQARILGSNDATYGTAGGWAPPTDGSPWALVYSKGTKEWDNQPWRRWVDASVEVFFAVDQADTSGLAQNYNAIANAWADAARFTVPAHWLLTPGSLTISPLLGNVRWTMEPDTTIEPAYPAFGSHWYGALVKTLLRFSVDVAYQMN